MNLDPTLVDNIKATFARRSSAKLREVARANDLDRWSPEAIAAADEVLQDRAIGRADEPEVPEEEPPPPPASVTDLDPYSLGFYAMGLFGGLAGVAIVPVYRGDSLDDMDPDLPVPFGTNTAWLALETTETAAVATALGLLDILAATWAEGIDAAKRASIFVTPPLADWTLAVGTQLLPPGRADSFVKPLLERLSHQFGEAQYFCTHEEIGLHIWARAQQGRLVRGYGWLGKKGLTLWDEGTLSDEETDLGLDFADGCSPAELSPSENDVMQLATLWSIDPTGLDGNYKEPKPGLQGSVTWGRTLTGK